MTAGSEVVDRGEDRAGRRTTGIALPEISFDRYVVPAAFLVVQHLHARPVRIGRMDFRHDRDFIGVEPDEIAGRVDSQKLDETPDQHPGLLYSSGRVRGEGPPASNRRCPRRSATALPGGSARGSAREGAAESCHDID
jgi:hypothetical protein